MMLKKETNKLKNLKSSYIDLCDELKEVVTDMDYDYYENWTYQDMLKDLNSDLKQHLKDLETINYRINQEIEKIQEHLIDEEKYYSLITSTEYSKIDVFTSSACRINDMIKVNTVYVMLDDISIKNHNFEETDVFFVDLGNTHVMEIRYNDNTVTKYVAHF